MMLENAWEENVMENWNIEGRFFKRKFLKRELYEKWSITNKPLMKLFSLKYEHKSFVKLLTVLKLAMNWRFTTLPIILMLIQCYKLIYWTNMSMYVLNKIYSSDSWIYVDMYISKYQWQWQFLYMYDKVYNHFIQQLVFCIHKTKLLFTI